MIKIKSRRPLYWIPILFLVKPNEVIVSHVNEMVKRDGKVLPGTRTAAFIEATNVPVGVQLSGRTMEFDHTARCVAGCGGRVNRNQARQKLLLLRPCQLV